MTVDRAVNFLVKVSIAHYTHCFYPNLWDEIFRVQDFCRIITPRQNNQAMVEEVCHEVGPQDTSTNTTTLLQTCVWILLLHGLVPAATDVCFKSVDLPSRRYV